MSWTLMPYRICDLQIFSPSGTFKSVNSAFDAQFVFNLHEFQFVFFFNCIFYLVVMLKKLLSVPML